MWLIYFYILYFYTCIKLLQHYYKDLSEKVFIYCVYLQFFQFFSKIFYYTILLYNNLYIFLNLKSSIIQKFCIHECLNISSPSVFRVIF